MCNSKYHSYGCSCGFGGAYHRGKRRASTQVKTKEDILYDRYPELRGSRSTAIRFVRPNAKCPECKAPVYYYQNEFGSRVFFDDLGPKWPKHPCTDRQLNSGQKSNQYGPKLELRPQSEVAEIISLQIPQTSDVNFVAPGPNGGKAWNIATITKRIKGNARVFIIARLRRLGKTSDAFLSCKSLPRCCKSGFLFWIGNRKISYLDPETLEPVTITVVRYRTANAFLDALTDASQHDLPNNAAQTERSKRSFSNGRLSTRAH